MKKILVLFILALGVLPACKKPIVSIRNPNVYANEIDYNNMVQNQAVGHLRYWLEDNCSCDSAGMWQGDHAEACEKTAKHILVVETRQPWYTALMEYNGSLSEERPAEDGPEIPETSTLCVQAEPAAPEASTPETESPEGEGN